VEHDTENSPAFTAEFKVMWSFIFTPPTCPHPVVLQHRDNFISIISFIIILATLNPSFIPFKKLMHCANSHDFLGYLHFKLDYTM
jgi:hypothetical protein